MGLPFAFASHFAPAMMTEAIQLYRTGFRPSDQLKSSYLMLGVNVVAAETDEESRFLFTSLQQAFINLRLGRPGRLPPPVSGFGDRLDAVARSILDQALGRAIVGSPDAVRRGLRAFASETGADELMITSQIFDHDARLRSFEIVANSHQLTPVS
jgi:luciferase family oxidoreductase group 1